MPAKILIRHEYAHYEWYTTYYGPNVAALAGAVAAIVDAERNITHPNVKFTGYESYNPDGSPSVNQVANFGVGLAGGDMAPIKYAILVRKNASPRIKNASVMYLHGYSENWSINEDPVPGLLAHLVTLTSACTSNGVQDSDGSPITSVAFRSFTRRKNLRRKP